MTYLVTVISCGLVIKHGLKSLNQSRRRSLGISWVKEASRCITLVEMPTPGMAPVGKTVFL